MYTIELKRSALKQLKSLPKREQERILLAFDVLRSDPLAGKALDGEYRSFRSFRVGSYRIIYTVDHGIITITVVKIGHRKNVY